MANNLNAKEITANTAGNYVQANSGIQQIVGAITEQQAITLTTANIDLTTGSDQDPTSNVYKALRSLYFQFTGTMDADHDVVLPTNKKLYVVEHGCAGGFDITFKCSGGTGVTISNGQIALLLCDGTDIFALDFFSATSPSTYTDEKAQDAVGGILDDGGDIDFTYDDATPKITAAVKSGAITEAKQTLADNTTANASTSAHGYLVKATAPASGLRNIVAIDNGESGYKNAALFDATNPAAIGTASPGSAMPAARRDHVHAADAANVTFTPADNTDWDGSADPGDVNDALDQLAERVAAVEGGGGGGGGQSLFTFSDITAISFTAVNGGGTFNTTTFGTVSGKTLSTGSETFNVRGRVISAPATPYSITIGVIPQFNGIDSGTNHNAMAGLFFRQSSDDKMQGFHVTLIDGGSSDLHLSTAKFTNSTTFSAQYKDVLARVIPYRGGLIWLRVTDNGTNRICSYSMDGVNFFDFHSVSRTDFLTADQVGIFVNANSNDNAISAAFVSWLQA
jgi:hypothetical protein